MIRGLLEYFPADTVLFLRRIMSETTPPLYAIPILDRPPTSRLRSIILIPLSFLVLLLMHLSQLAAFPLSYIPGGLREAFWLYNRLIKESFGRLLILLSGGTILRITMEGMGEGEVEEIWKKDEEGRMVLGLERRSLFISNHQVSRRVGRVLSFRRM
jgi:hypothetical protein